MKWMNAADIGSCQRLERERERWVKPQVRGVGVRGRECEGDGAMRGGSERSRVSEAEIGPLELMGASSK